MLPRKISYVPNHSHLKPGDILLFRVSLDFYISQQLIMFFQSLIQHDHGHYDTTHVAICVDDEKEIEIAHVTEIDDIRGYRREKLQQMLDVERGEREQGDRPYFVFRPKNPNIANNITQIARNIEGKKFEWTYATAIGGFLETFFFKEDEMPHIEELSASTICSKFAIETIKKAGVNLKTTTSSCLPKTLEKILYNDHQNFEVLCYPGRDPYNALKNEIETQLKRLGERTDNESINKFNRAKSSYEEITRLLSMKSVSADDFEKSIALVKAMLPVLSYNTGFNFVAPTSYKAVAGLARKLGIFQRDIDHYKFEQLSPRSNLNNFSRSPEVSGLLK